MTIKILPFLCLFGTSQIVAQLPQQPSPLRNQGTEQQRQIQEQNARFPQSNPQKQQQQQREVQAYNQEMKVPTIAYEFPENCPSSTYFTAAMTELMAMLEGKQPMSLKRAVFLSENAFFNNQLDYEGYCRTIDMEIDVIQAFMKKEGYSPDDDMAKKYCLQRLMSDTLVMKDAKGRIQFTHLPYRYDFDDPFAQYNYRKYFVTKLLAEKTGQCHSLPLLFLILAEALDVKAWLAYSPQHSYIKLQDKKGAWYNYETTNGHYSSDSWILSSGYINANTLKNHVFMDTLSTRQTIAACLVDLANASIHKCGYNKFALTAAEKALVYHPSNIQALQIKADYYTHLFDFVVQQLHYPPISLLSAYPQAEALYKKMHAQYAVVDKTGYQQIHETVYQDWLKSFDIEKQKQPVKVIRP